jgi:hypothetical protein
MHMYIVVFRKFLLFYAGDFLKIIWVNIIEPNLVFAWFYNISTYINNTIKYLVFSNEHALTVVSA